MIYCTQCGTAFDGNFCPKCGAPAGSVPPPPPAGPVGIPGAWASAICYIVPIVGPIVFLAVPPYKRDPKIRFDAYQAFYLQIWYIALQIVFAVFPHLPSFFDRILDMAYLVLVVFLVIKVFQNEKIVLPIVGPAAEKHK